MAEDALNGQRSPECTESAAAASDELFGAYIG